MDYILVPFNFSDSAKNALKFAINVGQHFKWDVTLLNVVTPKFVVGFEQAMPIEMEEIKQTSDEKLAKFIKDLNVNSITVKAITEVGFPPDVIKKYSNEIECALVCMGSKGTKGLQRLLLGNMAANIIKRVETPVLLVPELVEHYDIKSILFATNFTLNDDLVVNEILALAKLFDSKVFCMHISNSKKLEADKQKMDDLKNEIDLNKYKVNVQYDVLVKKDADKEEVIYEFMNQNEIDLLAVHSNHRNNLLQQLDNPSLARKLALSLKHPVLVFS